MLALWIALGGALGALARFGLSTLVHTHAGTDFPWGTLVVNVTGSFLLGVMLRWLEAGLASPDMRAFVATGILGAFTTFSTLSYETVMLMQDGQWTRAAGYGLGSLVLGVMALVAGMMLATLALRAGR